MCICIYVNRNASVGPESIVEREYREPNLIAQQSAPVKTSVTEHSLLGLFSITKISLEIM